LSGFDREVPDPSRAELAAAQERLVAALVVGGPPPEGFDAARIEAAARALRRKRAGEVARAWPMMAAAYGPEWTRVFAEWVRGRPPRSSWIDGFDFAIAHRARLPATAAAELMRAEREWVYYGTGEPHRRRLADIGLRVHRYVRVLRASRI
jgi:hypothetical protein